MTETQRIAEELRTPRAAAVAGIVFAVLLTTVIVLMHAAGPAAGADPSRWLSDETRRRAVNVALTLTPFAGIAFLWFIGVIRSRLGAAEDKLFATVFLGSGLLFVAMLFAGAAVLGSLLALSATSGSVPTDTVALGVAISQALLGTFGARMAAVFVLTVTSLGVRTKVVPRWLAVIGVASAVVLLLSPPLSRWSQLLFPVWVLLLSLQILVTTSRTSRES